jgi:hypothetical protein
MQYFTLTRPVEVVSHELHALGVADARVLDDAAEGELVLEHGHLSRAMHSMRTCTTRARVGLAVVRNVISGWYCAQYNMDIKYISDNFFGAWSPVACDNKMFHGKCDCIESAPKFVTEHVHPLLRTS